MADREQLLLLFDGHALIHRAFHALPPLAVNRTGEPTGAVFGFATMLLKVVADLRPTHWAIASPGHAPCPSWPGRDTRRPRASTTAAAMEACSAWITRRSLLASAPARPNACWPPAPGPWSPNARAASCSSTIWWGGGMSGSRCCGWPRRWSGGGEVESRKSKVSRAALVSHSGL